MRGREKKGSCCGWLLFVSRSDRGLTSIHGHIYLTLRGKDDSAARDHVKTQGCGQCLLTASGRESQLIYERGTFNCRWLSNELICERCQLRETVSSCVVNYEATV